MSMVFRRINGRIVPIAKATKNAYRAGKAFGAVERPILSAAVVAGVKKPTQVQPNRTLQAAGFATAIADGLFSGATFFAGGAKGFVASQAVSLGLSAGSTAANVASYAGRGNARARIKGIARQEAINTLVSYGTMAGTLLAIPSSRAKIIEGASKALSFIARKAKLVL